MLPDHEAMVVDCVAELTRTTSDSSALTGDTSRDFSLHNALYLDSLEASFVNQLYQSITSRGCLQNILWGPYSSQALPTNSCNSSHQFMVLQDGFWKKSNSKRNKPLLESTADSQFIQKNPWISHFTSARKRCIAACHDREHCVPSTGRVRAGRSSPAFYGSTRPSQLDPACSLCHHNSVSIAIEVSDQNFVDDEQGEKSSSVAVVKRLKVAEADASSNDQVVPFVNSKINNVSTASQAASEREEQVHPRLLPEHLITSSTQNLIFIISKRELSWK
ncbi:hypothetical protein P3X46_013879 [Hevea brasiliensis]|uniref:Uncharacterized protein n=1 Tax=Hevea brasiliensis TaxID=3981 RepID=A0ABQ9M4X2_HEVBR|nr:hypothetical protein P3X46_013879 [Hevea brasiliensis]